jgi:hypothetical protein
MRSMLIGCPPVLTSELNLFYYEQYTGKFALKQVEIVGVSFFL